MARLQRILIVEDDDELRRLYRHALSMAGYEVHEARSGFEALRVLDSNLPDAVVLDLMLPGIDGISVRRELAAQAISKHIPIVVVTGAADTYDVSDVACILRKPFSPDRLVEAIRNCLASGTRPAG